MNAAGPASVPEAALRVVVTEVGPRSPVEVTTAGPCAVSSRRTHRRRVAAVVAAGLSVLHQQLAVPEAVEAP